MQNNNQMFNVAISDEYTPAGNLQQLREKVKSTQIDVSTGNVEFKKLLLNTGTI